MNVAKASLSQMPFHHFIVTRSPNHMCAISWATTSAMRINSVVDAVDGSTSSAVSRKVTQPRFSIAPNAKSGSATRSSLNDGYGMPKKSAKKSQRVLADVERELAEVFLAGHARDAQRNAVGVDLLGEGERADDERDEVGRHRHRVGEAHASPPVLDRVVGDDVAVAQRRQPGRRPRA